jgi:hypothetical protein
MAMGGMIDLTAEQRRFNPPYTRLHDCQWPYPEVVDIHAIFRNPAADPAGPENYDFALTDDYLAHVVQTGAKIVYRLGESIEHAQVKRFVHPPPDPKRWAQVCLGIIRHYNEGWAKGYHYGIPYWEIWNEPENRPTMWGGTDADYLELYRVTARTIKDAMPQVKVGGPALGYSGRLENGAFIPSDFLTNFLAMCNHESVPLDFFSWHCYTADPSELSARARGVRKLLDASGFTKTESHLNEWNYLPGNSWAAFDKTAGPELRRDFYHQMSGVAGAVFTATALIELQDAPVDVANYYHGELGPFGVFDEFGAPTKAYDALCAFNELVSAGGRVATEGAIPGKLAILAAFNTEQQSAAVLVSNFGHQADEIEVTLFRPEEGKLPSAPDRLGSVQFCCYKTPSRGPELHPARQTQSTCPRPGNFRLIAQSGKATMLPVVRRDKRLFHC